MDPFIKQIIDSFNPEQFKSKTEGTWSELGEYKFYYSESERAKRVYSQNKYILYHYTSFDTAKRIIDGNSLRFSSPDNFNDPFDLNHDIFDYESTIEECVDFFCRFFPLDREAYTKRFSLSVSKDPDFIRKNGIQMLTEFKEDIGVICFSEEYNNALMWSHYADKHKGVCLGINLGSNKTYNIMPVNYIKEMYRLNFYKHLNPDMHLLYIWLYYKSHIWEYENEVRAICPSISRFCDNNLRLIKFPQEDLKEIYFGLKTSESEVQEIEQLLLEKGYKIKNIKREKMLINPATYSFKK